MRLRAPRRQNASLLAADQLSSDMPWRRSQVTGEGGGLPVTLRDAAGGSASGLHSIYARWGGIRDSSPSWGSPHCGRGHSAVHCGLHDARFYRSSWQRCAPLCTCAGVELEVGTGQPAGHRPPGCRDEARALCAIALGNIDHSHSDAPDNYYILVSSNRIY